MHPKLQGTESLLRGITKKEEQKGALETQKPAGTEGLFTSGFPCSDVCLTSVQPQAQPWGSHTGVQVHPSTGEAREGSTQETPEEDPGLGEAARGSTSGRQTVPEDKWWKRHLPSMF